MCWCPICGAGTYSNSKILQQCFAFNSVSYFRVKLYAIDRFIFEFISGINNVTGTSNIFSTFRQFAKGPIAIIMGIKNLLDVYEPEYYERLDGRILEPMARRKAGVIGR